MRKLIYMLLLGVFAACSKEDALTPSVVKNWYVITPTENMDEVDGLIYSLYDKYGKAVFYEDTIGSEDRGWKDENGNPKPYYEVLRLDYDMTELNDIVHKITYNSVDISTPEKKNAMLPLLKLMDEKLLPWVDGAEVFIPAILIVQDMERSQKPLYVHRGFGVLGFALNGYEQPNPDSLFQRVFLHEVCYSALSERLTTFHELVTGAFESGTSVSPVIAKDCWGLNYATFVSSYADWVISVNNMQTYADMKVMYQKQKDDALEKLKDPNLSAEERKQLESKVSSANMLINFADSKLGGYDEYMANLAQYGPESFGLLSLKRGKVDDRTVFYIPTKEEDFAAYLDALLDYNDLEFREKYKDFPTVVARYVLMKYVLEEVGFDLGKIKSGMK